jgi:hypothetical protein
MSHPDRTSTADTLASAVMAYARSGYAVLPLKPDGTRNREGKSTAKNPATKHGKDDASTNVDEVRQWWNTHPDSNIGLRPSESQFVIDVDCGPGHDNVDGHATLAELVAELGPLPDDAPVAETPTGGLHIWLSYDGGELFGSLGPGVEIKTHKNYLVAPPSATPDGQYRWRTTLKGKPPQAPDSWRERARKVPPPPRPNRNGHRVFKPVSDEPWVNTGIAEELKSLAACPRSGSPPGGRPNRKAGRNNWLNDTAVRTARLLLNVPGGNSDWLRGELIDACQANSLVADDGINSVEASINSAFTYADKQGRAVMPETTTPAPGPISADNGGDDDDGRPTVDPISLAQARRVFRKWLGEDFDTDGLDAMLASVAVERFADGSDPVWLLLISGPGNAKTETVQSLDGIGATVASSISSDAALLSASPKRERAKDATGGLLRKLGDRGVLVIKDVTSILSMDRTLRAKVLAALREVYDGRWTRDVGTDGGRTIPWTGRIAVIGAATTAWDTAHSVIATMGDRFVLVRLDSTQHRIASGRKAIGNTGDETIMRQELAAAAAGVIAGMSDERITLTDSEIETLLNAADLVTLARTGVEYDYKGDVTGAHAPEMPTRFAKQLAQIVRGAVALGMDRADAMRLAIRCAKDSMPPLRLEIIEDLAVHADSTSTDVRKRLKKPRSTVDRQLQALHVLGLAELDEESYGAQKIHWYYSLSADVSPDVLKVKEI